MATARGIEVDRHRVVSSFRRAIERRAGRNAEAMFMPLGTLLAMVGVLVAGCQLLVGNVE